MKEISSLKLFIKQSLMTPFLGAPRRVETFVQNLAPP